MDPNLSNEERRSLDAECKTIPVIMKGNTRKVVGGTLRAVNYAFETAHKARNGEKTVREIP